MKQLFLSALLTTAALGAAHAQSGYTFSVQTGQAYTPLTTGATNLTAGTLWDDNVLSVPVPFTFQLDRRLLSTLRIDNDGGIISFGRLSTNGDTLTAFAAMDGDLCDRGVANGIPASPIRYAVTGTAPARILKVEFFNAGFLTDTSTGRVDSVNFQAWFYEGTNAVELRYGGSHITPAHMPFYFQLTPSAPIAGFIKNADYDNGTYGKLYFLRGVTAAPTLDSASLPSLPTNGLAGYPASGTVYRFTPTNGGGSTSVTEALAAARALKLYPTAATEAVMVEWSGAEGESYQILSPTGSMVSVGRLQRGTQSIAVNSLPAGTYTLRVVGGGHVFVKR